MKCKLKKQTRLSFFRGLVLIQIFLHLLTTHVFSLRANDSSQEEIEEFRKEFNAFQKEIGNSEAKLDTKLNEVAKAHYEYLLANKIGKEELKESWLNQERGKRGFLGETAKAQAENKGIKLSAGERVLSFLTVSDRNSSNPKMKSIITEMKNSLEYQHMLLSGEFESIGFFIGLHPELKWKIQIFYGIQKTITKNAKILKYPTPNSKDVPLLSEPTRMEQDKTVTSYPISIAWVFPDASEEVEVLEYGFQTAEKKKLEAILKKQRSVQQQANAKNAFTFYAKEGLEPNKEYSFYLKYKTNKNSKMLEEKWAFQTTAISSEPTRNSFNPQKTVPEQKTSKPSGPERSKESEVDNDSDEVE